MQFQFLWIGATRRREFARLEDLYLEKIGRFFKVDRGAVQELKKVDPRSVVSQMEREAAALRKRLSPETFLICMDQKGKQLSSEGFAEVLENIMNQGVSDITFLVGGYSGIPEGILNEARMKLSLGRMTLPHELARVVLLEQLYRALTIIRGFPYHR